MDHEEHNEPSERCPPNRAVRWLHWFERVIRGKWKPMRGLLLVAEAGCVLTKHETPAMVARALVMLGDAVITPRNEGPR
ncbi:hypothetical protein [Actinokineospora cianjurensis]|uniref:Uncharacterized protein n=1 Tax=Actinokineospora cianjurensis TaxID=585224 RepID=A0A421BB78_9PSEU|nr:hypothetical protein [Actinokineospora cianjurensis]RLK61601.1 hypothetical protein CLV68_2142 [Actinokineospora cianjurensis]